VLSRSTHKPETLLGI
jgi:hypothetical protein